VKLPTGGYSPQAAFFDAARTGEIPVPTVTVRMREDVLRDLPRNFHALLRHAPWKTCSFRGNDKKECIFMSEPNVNAIPTTRATHHSRTHKLTVTAMLSTVAFLLMFIEFPIPALIPAFVKLDISDLPELLAAFSLGPIYGVIVTLLKNVLFSVLHVGELFNFIMGSVFSFTAGFIYQKKKSRKNALIGALVGALLMAVLSVPLNYFVVYPAYVVCYHLPLEAIIGMYQAIRPSTNGLLECLMVFNMPFTFVKGMIDVALCFLIYKPLSPLLHK
jgi:riboflavin transporter FmnP